MNARPYHFTITDVHISFQELKVYGNFTNKEHYPLNLVPVEHDLLSMEYEPSFFECLVERDLTSMNYVAESLMKLQALFGVIPK